MPTFRHNYKTSSQVYTRQAWGMTCVVPFTDYIKNVQESTNSLTLQGPNTHLLCNLSYSQKQGMSPNSLRQYLQDINIFFKKGSCVSQGIAWHGMARQDKAMCKPGQGKAWQGKARPCVSQARHDNAMCKAGQGNIIEHLLSGLWGM